MKKLILSSLFFAAVTGIVSAQQIPLYSNYFFTPYIYNPSLSGIDGSTEATILHRRQWSDIQGSPETSALAINGSLNEERVGWSLYAFTDQTDIVRRNGFYGNYAYHVQLSDNAKLSFGLGAGYLATTIDYDAVRAKDPNDVFSFTVNERGSFDLNAGINLTVADLKVGVAAPQLLAQPVSFSDNSTVPVNYQLIRHYVFNASYDFKFAGDKQVLTPMVNVRAADGVPVQVDAGALFNLKDYGYVGAMYRSEYAVTGNIGLNLTELLTLGYAYDFSLNDYGSSLGTSHEFMLTYRFGSNKRNERLENEIKRLKQQQRSQQDNIEEVVDERLEEFKSEYKRELDQQIKAEAERQAAEAVKNNPGAGSSNQSTNNNNATGGNNNQQGSNNTTGNTSNGNNSSANNQGNLGGYESGNQASNVQPGSKGYYVVAGVFSSEANANKLIRSLQGKNVDARYFQDMNNFYYYVYLLKFDSYQQADRAKSTNLNGAYNGDLWIKIIE